MMCELSLYSSDPLRSGVTFCKSHALLKWVQTHLNNEAIVRVVWPFFFILHLFQVFCLAYVLSKATLNHHQPFCFQFEVSKVKQSGQTGQQ